MLAFIVACFVILDVFMTGFDVSFLQCFSTVHGKLQVSDSPSSAVCSKPRLEVSDTASPMPPDTMDVATSPSPGGYVAPLLVHHPAVGQNFGELTASRTADVHVDLGLTSPEHRGLLFNRTIKDFDGVKEVSAVADGPRDAQCQGHML